MTLRLRALVSFACLVAAISLAAPPASAVVPHQAPPQAVDPPRIAAPSAFLLDVGTGQVLFERHANRRLPIASLTKMLTALVVVERAGLREVVSVSRYASIQIGSVLGLREGERIRIEHLLYAMMLQSSNDAAVALAQHVGGTVAAFVEMMNREAAELGLRDTRVESPNGLDDDGFSTAHDIALLARRTLEVPVLAEIVRTRFRDIPSPKGPPRHIQNRNALLWLYPGAIGVKTGFTTAAGYCLAAAAERDGRRVISVVLAEPSEAFSDSAALLDHGLLSFVPTTLVSKGQGVATLQFEETPVEVVSGAGASRLLRKDLAATLERRYVPLEGLALPVRTGQQLGWVDIHVGGHSIGRVKAVAARGADRPPPILPGDPPGFGWPLRTVTRVLGTAARILLGPVL